MHEDVKILNIIFCLFSHIHFTICFVCWIFHNISIHIMMCAMIGIQPADRPVPNATLQVTGAVGWRREGLAYKKNEVSLILSYIHSIWLLPHTITSLQHWPVAGLPRYRGKCKSSYVFKRWVVYFDFLHVDVCKIAC